jgi:hypothetical protein
MVFAFVAPVDEECPSIRIVIWEFCRVFESFLKVTLEHLIEVFSSEGEHALVYFECLDLRPDFDADDGSSIFSVKYGISKAAPV